MTLYASQLDTLNKHRGKGQRKVTVEHLRAGKGRQAIVGNIETSAKGNAEVTPPELEQNAKITAPLENPKKAEGKARKCK